MGVKPQSKPRPQSLSEWLQPYKQVAVAEAVGAHYSTVNSWYHDEFSPSPEYYEKLAGFLRLSVEDVARIIADDTMRRNLARVTSNSKGAA